MSELVKDVCKHGITFYPGKAEKEQVCSRCKMLAESGPTKLPLDEEGTSSSPTLCDILDRHSRGFGTFNFFKRDYQID